MLGIVKKDRGEVHYSFWEEKFFGPDGDHYRKFRTVPQDVGALTLDHVLGEFRESRSGRHHSSGADVERLSYLVVGPLKVRVPFAKELVDSTSVFQ